MRDITAPRRTDTAGRNATAECPKRRGEAGANPPALPAEPGWGRVTAATAHAEREARNAEIHCGSGGFGSIRRGRVRLEVVVSVEFGAADDRRVAQVHSGRPARAAQCRDDDDGRGRVEADGLQDP